jgi:hypothetical protein
VLPVNRQRAHDFLQKELQAASASGLAGRILIPLTRRNSGTAALQFEVQLTDLNQLDQFRTARRADPMTSPIGCTILAKS